MIRGASLLKDTESGSSPAEVDELRAELIKQKILFEAELRRQREVSDERFDTISHQLQNVLDDNTQLRRTLHALGDRLSIAEHQQTQLLANQRATAARGISPSSRSISPVVHQQSNRYGSNSRQQPHLRSADRRMKDDTEENNNNNIRQQQQLRRANTPKNQSTTAENSKDPSSAQRSSAIRRASSAGKNNNNNNSTIKNKTNSSALLSSVSTTTSHYPRTTQPPRQASPVPKILHVQNGNHQFVKIRSSPTTTPSQSANQTPRTTTTPRQPVTRTASNVSTKSNPATNNNNQNVVTSPAHIQFRPVLRSHTNTSSTGSIGGNNNNNSGSNSQNTSGIVFNNNSSSDQIGTNASLIRPFRSPMRQSDADKIGKQQVVHQSRWK